MENNEMANSSVEVHYTLAKFHHRVLADIIDAIIFALLFVGIFTLCRYYVVTSSQYASIESEITTTKIDSSLYHKKANNDVVDTVGYLLDADLSDSQKKNESRKAIENFIVYLEDNGKEGSSKKVQDSYDTYRLSESLKYNDYPYFIKDETTGLINENTEAKIPSKSFFESAYSPFLDKYCQSYLVSEVPGYYDNTMYESKMLFYLELPVSYLSSGILVYLIPPLCFRRNRYTLGKLLYHVGLVDSRFLAVKGGRFMARFCIFYFGELVLSLFTFGIPYIISFSLMAFSKHKQGFPDYLLGLYEVDLSKSMIYYSAEEIAISGLSNAKKPVDFKPEPLPK